MARGKVQPVFYLSSLDPGAGKTQAIVNFLRSLGASKDHAHVGVLIGLSRLDDIRDMAERAGLSKHQYAILTSDDALNMDGAPSTNDAQVLFTTQQMLMSRTSGRLLKDVEEFLYLGRPRQVRVWDEGFLPAKPITLRRDDLPDLIKLYRQDYPRDAEELDRFHSELRSADNGSIVSVPTLSRSCHRGITTLGLPHDVRELHKVLLSLSGRQVRVVVDGPKGHTLVDFADHLPADLAPLLILDASIRVRETYRLWREAFPTRVQRLYASPKSYEYLRVHLWERAAGQSELRHKRADFVNAAVSAIETKPDEEWLVFTYKREKEKFERELTALLPQGTRVHFETWGQHKSTNKYRYVSNVILLGVLNYPTSHLHALVLASSKTSSSEHPISANTLRRTAEGETKDHLLQALSRTKIRLCCPPELRGGFCEAYVVGPAARGLKKAITEAFPGSLIIPWMEDTKQLSGRCGQVADYLRQRFEDEDVDEIRFKEVREACDISKASNFTNNVINHEAFRHWLNDEGLEVARGKFRRTQPLFDDDEDEEDGT